MTTRSVTCLLVLVGSTMGCGLGEPSNSGASAGGANASTSKSDDQTGQTTATEDTSNGGSNQASNGSSDTSLQTSGGSDTANDSTASGGSNTKTSVIAAGGTTVKNSAADLGGANATTGGTRSVGSGTNSRGGSDTFGTKAVGGTSSKASNTASGAPSTGGAAPVTGGASSSLDAAPGCGKAGATTGVQTLTISVASQDREYVLSIPKNYDPSTALPLIFAWHGLGGNGKMASQYFGLERAVNGKAIIVYPSGLVVSDGQTGWTLTETGVDFQFFDLLLTELSAKYCVDLRRVFSTGHSYGGMMTNALGCNRGNVLRGIASVAGMPPFGKVTCKGPVAAWIAHGENDGTVDFTQGGIGARDLWLKQNGCSTSLEPLPVDPSPCVAYQECSDGHPVHWCVHQSDHNWPSFGGAGIWAFFDALK